MKKHKTLNRNNGKVDYPMQKRGQTDVIVGSIIILIIFLFGSYQSINALSENRYVLDTSTNTVYDLSKCSINNLDQSKLVSVRDLNELERKNYKMAKC